MTQNIPTRPADLIVAMDTIAAGNTLHSGALVLANPSAAQVATKRTALSAAVADVASKKAALAAANATLASLADDGNVAVGSVFHQVVGHFGLNSPEAGDFGFHPAGPPSAPGAPDAPSALEIESAELGGLVLTWRKAKAIDEYEIWRKESAQPAYSILTNFKPLNAHLKMVTYTDNTAAAAHTYYYYIVSRHKGLSSSPSNTEHATAL